MCLELLLEAADAGRRSPLSLRRRRARSLCDLGCGSGVLAIAAAMLGFRPVLGVDTDQAAVEESARNARPNFVEIELRRVDLKKSSPPPADVVTANLTAGLLTEVAASWSGSGSAPGTAIVSGFLTDEADAAASSLAAAGLREKRRLRDGEWSALLADAAR
jgi:ribosomal protein L11 methyltransferase